MKKFKIAANIESAISMKLVNSTSPKGCTLEQQNVKGMALLVERGQCSFQQKVEIGKQLGASSVIVMNTPDSAGYECSFLETWTQVCFYFAFVDLLYNFVWLGETPQNFMWLESPTLVLFVSASKKKKKKGTL